MAGRGDKGLLVTTGSFTRDAVAESSRDRAPPIELIDGDRLADLLKEFSLGVSTHMVEEVEVQEAFFDDI
jgi:restriction system protein